jgi:propionyl-CoA carboxylase alpha chain
MNVQYKICIESTWHTVHIKGFTDEIADVVVDKQSFKVKINDSQNLFQDSLLEKLTDIEIPFVKPETDSRKIFASPLPGVIVSVSIEKGDTVITGDTVCVLEAMKMQQVLKATWSGVVSYVHVKEGQQISSGHIIMELE